MPEQVDKRVEYRVVGENARDEQYALKPVPFLNQAQAQARGHELGGCTARVQKATVTESRTPWKDVADV